MNRVALAIVILTAGHAIAGDLPKDPCALLKADEVQSLASAPVAAAKPETGDWPIATGCHYPWGARSDKWGQAELKVTVFDLSKAYPGRSPDLLKQGLLMKLRAKDANGSEIAGVGDAAVFTYEARSFNAMAETLLLSKGYHVTITHHGDSASSKDKLAALLKSVARRL